MVERPLGGATELRDLAAGVLASWRSRRPQAESSVLAAGFPPLAFGFLELVLFLNRFLVLAIPGPTGSTAVDLFDGFQFPVQDERVAGADDVVAARGSMKLAAFARMLRTRMPSSDKRRSASVLPSSQSPGSTIISVMANPRDNSSKAT